MASRPRLKLRTVVKSPARVVGGDLVEVTTENGVTTIELALSEAAVISSVADPDVTGIIVVTPGESGEPDVVERMLISTLESAVDFTVADDSITFAKMQNITTDRILGRDTASSGNVEELTLTQVLDFIGSAAQGDILYRGASAWARLAAGTNGHFLRTNGPGANPSYAAVGGGGDVLAANNGSDFASADTTRINLNAPLYGHLYGLTTSNNGADANNDIDIAVGEAASDDASAPKLMRLTSALTKRIDASWAVGTNQGGLDGSESVAGTPDVSTWYYLYLIKRLDTGVVDVLFSESPTSPTMPTNYTHKRLIGVVRNTSGGDILGYTQIKDWFYWNTMIEDVASPPVAATLTSHTLTVPPILGVEAKMNCMFQRATSQLFVEIIDGFRAAQSGYYNFATPTSSDFAGNVVFAIVNGSGQIKSYTDATAAQFLIRTQGFRMPL